MDDNKRVNNKGKARMNGSGDIKGNIELMIGGNINSRFPATLTVPNHIIMSFDDVRLIVMVIPCQKKQERSRDVCN